MEEELEEQEENIWIKIFSFTPPLKQYQVTGYFNYESRFKGVFLRNNLPRIKHGSYVTNIDNKNSEGTIWVSLFNDRNAAVYFDSFGIEYIPQEVLNKIRDKSINHNIFRIQDNEFIMCGFYCITFIEYIPAAKILLDYTNLFSPYDYKNN